MVVRWTRTRQGSGRGDASWSSVKTPYEPTFFGMVFGKVVNMIVHMNVAMHHFARILTLYVLVLKKGKVEEHGSRL